jgi:hypothetical protein
MRRSRHFASAALALLAACALTCVPASAALLEGLPGKEVTIASGITGATPSSEPSVDSLTGVNWLSPPVHMQLSRDPALITLGKGAIFLPVYSESRREPEIAVLSRSGELVATGQMGTRILLDSGNYEVRFGSGVNNRRLRALVRVEEGHTTTVPPTWGGVIIETLTENGEYIDGEYDLVGMDQWINYGRGQGYGEERLQDIDAWILPPGLYRISRVGEGYNSLRNYITVQVNAGELHAVEAIFDADNGDLIAGGVKSLNTRARAGEYWTYGIRAGGNASFTREITDADDRTKRLLFSTDMRLRARYDRDNIFGISEVFLQNSFVKLDDEPLQVAQDFLQIRSTWVRRLNSWIGPYVRGQVSTHLFPFEIADTVRVIGPAGDTSLVTDGTFVQKPSFFPLALAEGLGVNVEWLSAYAVEVSTQTGLAARQDVARGDYLALESDLFEGNRTSSSLGAEGILTTKLRLSSRFTLDLRVEAYAEDFKLQDARLENLEADFRFFLTRNIEIGYLFQMEETQADTPNRFPRTHSVSLRLSFNY